MDLLILGAAIATLAVLSRQLPLQNILAIAILIGVIGGLTDLVCGWSPRAWWTIPLPWIISVINSRGVARLILRSQRERKGYGIRLLSLAFFLTVALDYFLKCLRSENPGLVNLAGMSLATSVALLVTVPWFIDKRNVEQSSDFRPLVLRMFLVLLGMATDTVHHAYWRMGFELLVALFVTLACAPWRLRESAKV